MISVLTEYHLSVFEFQLIYAQTVQARNVSYFIRLMYPIFLHLVELNGFVLFTQKKEWTWDESKMMVMQDPIYR